MSMYKNIFVTEDQDFTGENVISLNGEVYMFGETAFSSLDEAVASVGGNAVVIKVASGKYENYVVYNNGTAGAEVAISEVIAVDFGGATLSDNTEVAPALFTTDEQVAVMNGLNSIANAGTLYVVADENINADSKVYVTSGAANYQSVDNATVVSGSSIEDIFTLITGQNPSVGTEVVGETEKEAVTEAKTIFVSAEYAGSTDGVKFGSFEDALVATRKDASITRIEIESDITEQVKDTSNYNDIRQDLVIGTKDGASYTINILKNGDYLALRTQNGSTLTIEENVVIKGLDVVANGFATTGENMYINGSIEALSLKQWTSNGEIVIGETGKVALGYGDGQFDMAYGNGSVTVNGTGDWSEAQFKAGYSGTRGNGNTLNLNDTYFEAGRDFTFNGTNGTINADNSLFKISGGDLAGALNINKTGNVVNLKNGSLLDTVNVNLAAGNTINVEDSDVKVTNIANNGTVNVKGGTLDVASLTDNGKVTITNATLKADSISGSNAEANRILVEGNSAIEIGTLSKDLSINSIAKSDLTVTDMSIDKLNNTVRTYGNTTLSGAKINADHQGAIVSASGILNNINNVVVADNSKMYLNSFYARSGSIEAGSEVNAANFGLYSFLEGTEAANFEIAGTVNAVTFQIVSGAKNPESTVTVANGAAVNGYTQSGNGRFDIQTGNLEVYGYVNGNWASGGGTSEIGGHGYASTLTVDGTYAAADNNNGKFINSGDQVLNIFDDGAVNVINGATFDWSSKVNNAGEITIDNSSFIANGGIKNTGKITIAGESTVNISSVEAGSEDIELAEGAILKDSTIMGDVGVTGDVIFRGKNVLNNIYDFGEYDSYGSGNWAKWTVEAGSQLFLEQTATGLGNNLYGVGYGDTVTINGTLTDAQAARQAGLSKDDASFYSRTGVRFSSGNGYATSYFTVNNAYAILGTDGSFSNSAKNGGEHVIDINTSVIDAAQFYFSESTAKFTITIDDSDVKATIFMTEDANSTYSLTNSKLVTTGSGTDRYNGNGGTFTITNSSVEIQSGNYKNSGTLNLADSTLKAAALNNTGTVSITVSNDKIADLAGVYTIVEQTNANAAALDFGVTYNGTTYYIGQSFMANDIVYTITNGDGNDIAIKANSKVVTLDSTATENGFTVYNKADTFFAEHASYETRMQGAPEEIKVVGTNALESTASKYFVYTDSDLSISGGTLDVSSANRFYFMDTVAAKGSAAADADFSDIATVTIEEGATLKGYINLGQAIDANDVDADGNVTRDGGAVNMIVKGTLDQKNLYVNSGSTLTVTETGKVTNYASGGDNHVRAGGKLVVNGTGKDGDVQFKSNWFSIRGGEMEFNNTNADTGTLRLDADNDNAIVVGDTEAVLKVNNSKLTAHAIEVNNADSSFTAIDSDVVVKDLFQNYGSAYVINSTLQAGKIVNNEYLYINGSAINAKTITGSGYIYANGTFSLNATTITQDAGIYLGLEWDGAKWQYPEAKWEVKNDISVTANKIYGYQNSSVSIAADVTMSVTTTNGGTLFLNGVTDVDGKLVNAGVFQTYGLDVDKAGSIETKDLWTYAKDAKKDTFNVEGTVSVEGNAYIGTTGDDIGTNQNKVVFNLNGENASLTAKNAKVWGLNGGKNADTATLNITDGASLVASETFTNDGTVTADATSTFTVGSYEGYGSFNSANAGEMIVLGKVNVNKTLSTDSLTVAAGGNLTVGTLKVADMTLAIGSTLTVTGTGSSVGSITVVGSLVPENAEFTLVADGWDKLGYTGTINYKGNSYTIGQVGANDIIFTVNGGSLYIKNEEPVTTGIYIGDDVTGNVGDKIVVEVNGAKQTYTIGVDAFASAADAETNASDEVKAKTEVVTVNSAYEEDGKIANIKETFVNADTIIISKDGSITDNNTDDVTFAGDLEIINDGHFEYAGTIVVDGDLNFTNSAKQSWVANVSANNIYGDNTNGKTYDITLEADNIIDIANTNGEFEGTKFVANDLTITGGDATNVTADVDFLNLNDTNSFGMNAESTVITNDGFINLNGSSNMSIDGDVADSYVNIDGFGGDHTGTLTLNGDQTFSGSINANKIVIADNRADDKDVTINGTIDFNELAVEGKLNVDLTQQPSFSDGGALTGAGDLNVTHTGAWVVNDSVARDVSGFEGTVSMADANASIVLGSGDFNSTNATDSYFSDDAKVIVNGAQSVVLSGDTVNTGIDFSGNGSLNVGDYDNGFADRSEDFSQTLSGNNSAFTGTVNVAEGAVLNVENALGATSINLNAEAEQSSVANAEEFDTKLVLNKDGLNIAATITGDANDIIAVKDNATLSADNSNFKGIVNIDADKALSIKNNLGAKTVNFAAASELNVDATATIAGKLVSTDDTASVDVANGATATFSAEGALNGFNGNIALTDKAVVVLDKENTTDATFSSNSTKGNLILNADQTFNADGALDNLQNKITLGSNDLTLGGENTYGSIIVGDAASNLNLNADLTLSRSGMSLYQYNGTVNVNDSTLTILGTENTNAKFTGKDDAEINMAIGGILNTAGALNDFNGNIEFGKIPAYDGKNYKGELTLKGENSTKATFETNENGKLNISANQTFKSAGAINNVEGTINIKDNTLTLEGANTTSATLTGKGVIDADANQTFTGDVSAFTGTYDIATGATVTMSATSTIANTINAKGDTLTLQNTAVKDITVNAGAGNALTNLNFGGNDVTLGTGDFTNVIGTGDITEFGADKDFSTVKAENIYVAGDNLTITEALQAVINLTISGNSDTTADVNFSGAGAWDDAIKVVIANDFSGAYKLVSSANGYTITQINLAIGNENTNINIGDAAQIGGYTYRLINDNNTLVLDKMSLYSNFVVINSAWAGNPYKQVDDNGTIRNIGYDAAQSLDNAAAYIKGWDKGTGWIENGNTVEVVGGAKMELTEGKYTLTDGKYLMTADNEVTNLTLAARNGESATLNGVVRGSNGAEATTLNIKDVQIAGNLFAGGDLVINNANAGKSTATVIAAGVDKGSSVGSELVLNGGTFSNRYIVGGSYNATAGSTVTVNGDTGVVIDNKGTTTLTISGNIYGGSYAAQGSIEQTGTAYVYVNAGSDVSLRGNIYVSGYNATLNGDSIITFTGDASNLYFTGSVNATQSDYNEIAIFDDFSGAFNGTLIGFDSITISGASSLEFGRRQAKASETSITFNVDSSSKNAMYVVRDANNWEFAKSITIDVADNIKAGTYTLVDNYVGGYEGFVFTLEDTAYTLNSAVTIGNKQYTITTNGDSLVMQVVNSYSGDVAGTVSGTAIITDATVASNVEGTFSVALDAEINGDTVINGRINANAKNDSIEITEGANVTVKGSASDGNGFFTNAGNDTVSIADNATLVVEGGHVSLGAGDDTMVIGENVDVVISAANAKLQGGAGNDTLIVGKGSSITSTKVEDFNITMDVDAVLNNTCAPNLNSVNNVKLNVVGVTDLVLNGVDVAGAKSIFGNLGTSGHTLKVDGVDMILDASYAAGIKTAGAETSDQRDDLWTNIGEAKQIAGADTVGDTSDDVWASLNKIDNNLVVAWGRSETEVGAALDAFKSQTDLSIGQAVVSNDLSDGFETTDVVEKKNNGTLA